MSNVTIPTHLRPLFKPPFAACPEGVFVFDADASMASSPSEHFGMIPRGWGWHQYMPVGPLRAEELHNEWCEWFEANIPGDVSAERCAEMLNEAWR